jgi:4-hydroxy 2-oxovalerate aldolase
MSATEMKYYDVTLRDGNHAIRHALEPKFVKTYCQAAIDSNVWAVEIGHGNGLGASSYLVGRSKFQDFELLEVARASLGERGPKLAVHCIPGFATLKRDIVPALNQGVELFRVATHVSEATVAKKHIEFVANSGAEVHGVLMMSHMIDINNLVEQAKLMKDYGATAVVLMDSAGFFVPSDVAERVLALRNEIGIEVGFHAHNNLGLAVANANTAAESGAQIIDGASMGLGAGAGNAQLENIIAFRIKMGEKLEMEPFLDLSALVEKNFADYLPRTTSSSTSSGMAGVFSGYAPQVLKISEEFGLEAFTLWNELGKRKLVAGQESMIREVANDLMNL